MTDAALLNATHEPQARSWVASANAQGCDFPLQNLPFAVFRRDSTEGFRGGVAIGDQVLDLAAAAATGAFKSDAAIALAKACAPQLNSLMELGPRFSSALRLALFEALRDGSRLQSALQSCLVPQGSVEYSLPARIGDYTDFFSSIHHAVAVGRLFRPDNPLMPNYKWVPIGYHGRASSIGVSGQTFHRPRGQRLPPGESKPIVGASQRLDYELELGFFVGRPNALGEPIPIGEAESHVFGVCLLNDWSARDLQAWEYQPLGPFLAKNFATSISPWVVTLEALAPFRAPFTRSADCPEPLDYLDGRANREAGAIDIRLEAFIESAAMRKLGLPPHRLSSTSFRHSYWTIAQLVAHHTINGCNLLPGDLLGSGTQSGPLPEEAGSLLELSVGGKHPVSIGKSESRSFLEDGDTVIFRAWCERSGRARIGFGEVSGQVLPAIEEKRHESA
jgi:fumarylacetoacetase